MAEMCHETERQLLSLPVRLITKLRLGIPNFAEQCEIYLQNTNEMCKQQIQVNQNNK